MNNASATVQLAEELITYPSVTPQDLDCQAVLIQRLQRLQFAIDTVPYENTSNFWALRGDAQPVLVFAGHTDVVPTGPESQWHTPPFTPTIKEGYLYGRGAADMKGSLAAMVVACEQFVFDYPQHNGAIGFLITSAEEGPSQTGTPQLLHHLQSIKQPLDWCIVGEPTAQQRVGDTVKVGRRGSLNGYLTIKGKQGHIAYPHLADNPIHRALAALQAIVTTPWDQGNQDFPPTSLQLSNINSGTGATNVIPGQLELMFNFRYSPEVTAQQLQQQIVDILQQHSLDYELTWDHSGKPYHTTSGQLLTACQQAIASVCGITAQLSTTGGTSDGRFIAEYCPQVVELGPGNATIHQVNECVAIRDLEQLTQIYYQVLVQLLA